MVNAQRRCWRLRCPCTLEVIHPTFKVDELERTINGIKATLQFSLAFGWFGVQKILSQTFSCQVPTTRADQHSTNFILNQTAGKLPLKEWWCPNVIWYGELLLSRSFLKISQMQMQRSYMFLLYINWRFFRILWLSFVSSGRRKVLNKGVLNAGNEMTCLLLTFPALLVWS